MGFMTEICFLNDGWHELAESIKKDPGAFVSEINELMNGRYRGNGLGREFPGDFDRLMRLGNGSTVYPSHHADVSRLYLSWRNSFLSLDHYDLAREFPAPSDGLLDVLERDLKEAQRTITASRKWLKEQRAARATAE